MSTEPRSRRASSASGRADGVWLARSRQLEPRAWSTPTPRSRSIAAMVSMSSMRGTLRSSTGWSLSRHAAIAGSAAFLLPEAATVPSSRCGPVMRSTFMAAKGTPRDRRASRRAGQAARRVPRAMCTPEAAAPRACNCAS